MKQHFSFRKGITFAAAILFLPLVFKVHHLFVTGLNPVFSTILLLFTLTWAGAVFISATKETPKNKTVILYALVFLLIAAALAIITLGNSSLDIQLKNTYFVMSPKAVTLGLALIIDVFSLFYLIVKKK